MRGKNIKRKAAVISAIAITAALAAYGTAAYFTAEDTATNVITAGNVKIELVERMKSGDDLVPFENAVGVMPGARVSKIAQVEIPALSRVDKSFGCEGCRACAGRGG